MIGEFKNATKANIGNAFHTLYTAPADGAYIIDLSLASLDISGIQVTVRIHDDSSGEDVHIIKSAPVPVGAALQVVSDNKIVLEENDYVEVKCDTPGEFVDAILSYVENVNQ